MGFSVKLTLPSENVTRKATFEYTPTWRELSGKVESLFSAFNIKASDVALSYIDSEGDAVTLSSDEELRDFIFSEAKGDGPFKFFVKRLAQGSAYGDGTRTTSPGEDRDWERMDRDPFPDNPPLQSMPLFGDDGNMLHSVFAYVPDPIDPREVRIGSPAISEARIEEVPSRSNSTPIEQVVAVPDPANSERGKKTVRDKKGRDRKFPEGKYKAQVSSASIPSVDPFANSSNHGRPNLHHRTPHLDSDPEDFPLPPSVDPNSSLYNDMAGIMTQLKTILNKASDGSYIQSAMEGATSAAREAAIAAARNAVQDTARNVDASLSSVLEQLTVQPPRSRSRGGVPASRTNPPSAFANLDPPTFIPSRRPREMNSTSAPQAWSMFSHDIPVARGDSGPASDHSAGQSSQAEERAPRPFIPPPFVPYAPKLSSFPPRDAFSTSSPAPLPRPLGGRAPAGRFGAQTFHGFAQAEEDDLYDDFTYPIQPPHLTSSTAAETRAEKAKLEHARQMYKKEKARFRKQREKERIERAERKAIREKGGPVLDQLAQSLEAALQAGSTASSDEDEERPTPIRPSDMPELFIPPMSGHPAPPTFDERLPITVHIPEEPLWHSPRPRPRGPHHEQTDRILNRLSEMGFPASTHPQIPSLVRTEARNNLSTPDGELIDRILEKVVVDEEAPSPLPTRPGPTGGRKKGGRK